jgi:hypothetical protein
MNASINHVGQNATSGDWPWRLPVEITSKTTRLAWTALTDDSTFVTDTVLNTRISTAISSSETDGETQSKTVHEGFLLFSVLVQLLIPSGLSRLLNTLWLMPNNDWPMATAFIPAVTSPLDGETRSSSSLQMELSIKRFEFLTTGLNTLNNSDCLVWDNFCWRYRLRIINHCRSHHVDANWLYFS